MSNILNQLFPEANRGKDLSFRTFDFILANEVDALREWVSAESVERVNKVATEMLLHPLHVCAMTGNLACAEVLIGTKVCEINPQDASGATPLHHAAVRNHREMIRVFLQNKGRPLFDKFGGSYANTLRQIQEPDPDKQKISYRNETGRIVEGNGRDFQRLTGGALFLDRECHITPEEWVKRWQKKEAAEPHLMPPSLERAYEEFSRNPPALYFEEHPHVKGNICAGQDIVPGMVVGEYLASIESECSYYKGEEWERHQEAVKYVYGDMNAACFRGLIPICNDSFPNARSYRIYNQKGMPVRYLLVATQLIKKGEPIVYNYGLGHGIRFERRHELRREAFLDCFRFQCSQGFGRFVNRAFEVNDRAIEMGCLPEAEESTPIEAFGYIFTTPAAMLRLLCEKIIGIDEVKPLILDKSMKTRLKAWVQGNVFIVHWAKLMNFYWTAFKFFEELNKLSDKKKNRRLANLKKEIDSTDTEGLIQFMGGDPRGYVALISKWAEEVKEKRAKEGSLIGEKKTG